MHKKIPMKIIKICALLVILSVAANAQTVRKNMAEKYFGYLDFSKAAPIYDELAHKTVKQGAKKGKAVDWNMVRRAAQSHFYMRNYGKAAEWYEILVKGKAADKEDFMTYFEALRYTGNYAKASVFLDSLYKLDKSDAKVREYLRQSNYYNFLKQDSARFKVQKMPFNKDLGDFGPAFYDKGLVYASARRKGTFNNKYGWDNTSFLNVYYVKADGDQFSKKSRLQKKSFKSTPHDGPVFYSKDGNTAYITKNRSEKDHKRDEFIQLNLYIIQKGTDGKWGAPQPFQYNGKGYSIGHAALSPDEKTLYFASDMPGGIGGVDIWKSEKQGGGWSKPVNLGAPVNTPDDEMFPFVSTEGSLYFASKGHVGLGGFDIFESRFAGNAFTSPVNMGYPVNTHFDDFALITYKEGKAGYFSSDRTDYVDRIYGVTMEKRLIFNLEGRVLTSAQKQVVPDAKVTVRNKTLGDSIVTTTDDSGRFYVPLLAESDYEIVTEKPDFAPVAPAVLTTKGLTESKNLTAELYLKPSDRPLTPLPGKNTTPDNNTPADAVVRPKKEGEALLVIRVVDCADGKKIVNMPLVLKDLVSGIESRVRTDENGELLIPQPLREVPLAREFAVINEALEMGLDGNSYVPAVKKLYFIVRGNEPNLTDVKEICLEKLKEGDEFELKDIYYDFDKSTLRPLSIVQLDKAYQFLMRNPGVKLQLSSHTDSRASFDYNMRLSQRRAESCVDYLTKVKGVPANRIVAKGYGESRLTNGCSDGVPCTEEEHQMNRRTEIRILKTN